MKNKEKKNNTNWIIATNLINSIHIQEPLLYNITHNKQHNINNYYVLM